MKNGIIGDFGAPSEKELAEINKFTRRALTPEEVYVFSVVLCDNDVDRDFECFTDEALNKMAELFVGKTGIFDHSHKATNQCARIFECSVKTDSKKRNRQNMPYKQLLARAYMPKSDNFKELILEIDAGIKKEVSVGCSMGKSTCSICGSSFGKCDHKKGRYYRKNGKNRLCFFELSEPLDAYEWSFVAVPAQPKAGVVKAFSHKEIGEFLPKQLLKAAAEGELNISAKEAAQLLQNYEDMLSVAVEAGEFLKKKKKEILAMYVPDCNIDAAELFLKAFDRLQPDELYRLYGEGIKKSEDVQVQLKARNRSSKNDESNKFFVI